MKQPETPDSVREAVAEAKDALVRMRRLPDYAEIGTGFVQTRDTFAEDLFEALEHGAGLVPKRDLSEDEAQALAVQISQSLGVQSLSISDPSNNGLLALFKQQ